MFKIFCGVQPTQNVRWLGHVAIARTDLDTMEGWKVNGMCTPNLCCVVGSKCSCVSPQHTTKMLMAGIPTNVRRGSPKGDKLDFEALLTAVLESGDHVYVSTSTCRQHGDD